MILPLFPSFLLLPFFFPLLLPLFLPFFPVLLPQVAALKERFVTGSWGKGRKKKGGATTTMTVRIFLRVTVMIVTHSLQVTKMVRLCLIVSK